MIMSNEIFVNDLIQWNSGNENDSLIERIVWIDEGYTNAIV